MYSYLNSVTYILLQVFQAIILEVPSSTMFTMTILLYLFASFVKGEQNSSKYTLQYRVSKHIRLSSTTMVW